MSDFENPYNSPETPIVPEKTQDSGMFLSETMLGYLKEASPWLRFIGILGFIGCGFMCFMGIILPIVSFAASSFLNELGDTSFRMLSIVSLIYIPIGVLYFFPARFTYNFGTKIRNYQFSNSSEDLEQAFKNNKSLWKFIGILCIVSLAFIPVSIIITIFGALASVSGIFN